MQITVPPGGRRCRRCNGTGEFSRAHGVCFSCQGAGFTILATKIRPNSVSHDRRIATIDAIRAYATNLDGFSNGPIEAETSWSRAHLESHVPDRFERLVSSVEAGRIKEVVDALREYHRQCGH